MSWLPDAVVFDCDGTLADTEPISDRALADVLSAYGYAPTDADIRAVVGRPYLQTYAHFSAKLPLGDPDAFRLELRARFRARFDAELALFDDALGVLRHLAAQGVGIGVASSSTHAHVRRVLERAAITDLVSVVVGSDDVRRHKPHPEPYLRAIETLGAVASRSAAVEDTDIGVASARAAGLYTVAVVRGHVPREDLAHADRVVDAVTLADLQAGPWRT